jgi:eukaryotic-like serine/threonine-protein kinase
MVAALIPKRMSHLPAAMEPGENAGKALANAMTEWQVARPFMPIDQGEETAFIERWLDWFARAAAGSMRMPNSMPELSVEGSWRRS